MNDNEVRNKEINLLDLFWYLLSRWRRILLSAMIAAFLFGAFTAIPSFSRLHNAEYLASLQATNEKKLQDYEEEKAHLEERLALIEEELGYLENYAENSPLFRISPNNVYVCEQVYYIDVESSLLSDGLFPLDSSPVCSAYHYVILETASSFALEGQFGDDPYVDMDAGESLLTVFTDETNNLLIVRAIGASNQEAEAVMATAAEAIADHHDIISKTIGKHTLTLFSSNQYHTLSKSLMDLHNEYTKNYEAQIKEYNTVKGELDALEKPVLSFLSVRLEAKRTIKYALVGCAIGGILSLLFYAVRFAVLAELANPKDLTDSSSFDVLCVIPTKAKRIRFDQWIDRHRGLESADRREECIKYSAATIRQLAGDTRSLLFVGTVDSERIALLCEELKPLLTEFCLNAGSDPSTDADTVIALNHTPAVIVVEEIGKSRHADISRELHLISRSPAKVLGFLLIGKE